MKGYLPFSLEALRREWAMWMDAYRSVGTRLADGRAACELAFDDWRAMLMKEGFA